MKNRELANMVQRMVNKSDYKKETELKSFKAIMLNLKKDLVEGKPKQQLLSWHKKATDSYSKVRRRANQKVLNDMFIDLKHKISNLSERK